MTTELEVEDFLSYHTSTKAEANTPMKNALIDFASEF